MKDIRILVVIVAVLILVIGISAVLIVGRIKPTEGELADAIPVEVSSEEIPQKDKDAVVKTNEESTPGPAETILEDELIVPTARTGLTSTNPGVVDLASGELQLVEFFAFW